MTNLAAIGLLFCALVGSLGAQSLTVNSGALGASLATGSTNHVWADPPPESTVFDRWTGDTQILADPYAWHTTVVMPAAPATLNATYKPAPVWTPTSAVLNGLPESDPNAVRLIYAVPPNPVGVIFVFHGGGGSASGWFGNNVENVSFLRDAVAAGYAVAALDSTDRINKQWDASTLSDNVDVVRVQGAINYLVGLELITSDTPRFSVGMSNGGGFAPRPAYWLNFNACAIWCSSGAPQQVFEVTTVPTLWNLARNDNLFEHPNFLQGAESRLAKLTARSIAGEIREHPPSPVHARRFLRIPGLTEADAQLIFASLNDRGYLDAGGFLLADPNTSGWQAGLLLPPRFIAAILDQLVCCYSGHGFFSEYGNKTLQFFGARRPPVPGRNPISGLVWNAEGALQLTVSADAGQACRIEFSPDLVGWTTVFTQPNPGGTFDWSETAATGPARRFYRTVSP